MLLRQRKPMIEEIENKTQNIYEAISIISKELSKLTGMSRKN